MKPALVIVAYSFAVLTLAISLVAAAAAADLVAITIMRILALR